jgi:hypothetical protein
MRCGSKSRLPYLDPRGKPPVVTGEEGLRALETATRITEMVHAGKRD